MYGRARREELSCGSGPALPLRRRDCAHVRPDQNLLLQKLETRLSALVNVHQRRPLPGFVCAEAVFLHSYHLINTKAKWVLKRERAAIFH